jgi:hypothetical protein
MKAQFNFDAGTEVSAGGVYSLDNVNDDEAACKLIIGYNTTTQARIASALKRG